MRFWGPIGHVPEPMPERMPERKLLGKLGGFQTAALPKRKRVAPTYAQRTKKEKATVFSPLASSHDTYSAKEKFSKKKIRRSLSGSQSLSQAL